MNEVPDAETLDAIVTEAAAPYEGIDIAMLPTWWQEAIAEFEAHGLHPFQPARLLDGELMYVVRQRLEDTHDVSIDIVGRNVTPGDEWEIRLDGEAIGTAGHRRTATGYSVFELTSQEFERMVKMAI